ncbi:LacI family DNA-binding transcriptional regulator [Andreprevotia chitinilytica]|uniref:LacI family DNA-binding transcriptional regulator n=1 Tax=Andreprevotia chitinilytica TaxID=396808 RepID=UPI0005534D7C|nr:LacI family DNA-binding transcriptional regulator [Andreprevotia chitinilytica]
MTTLAEVARQAGVTTATVSNVLRGRGKVGEETRRRVLAIVEELGYRPNLTARALAEGRPLTLALVVSSIANPFYPQFALAAEQAARKQGYFLIVCNTNDDPALERAYLDEVGGSLAHGVLVMNADFVEQDVLLAAEKRGTSIVLCMWERPEQPPELPSIAVDFYRAGEIAAEHLLELGHRHVGAIVGSERNGNHIWRYRGFCDAMARAGVTDVAEHTCFGHDTIEAGHDAAERLLTGPKKLSAIFVTNDLPALGVLQTAVDLGLKVPTDLSVIGITDIQLARQIRPALSTVAVPTQEAAEMAVNLLLSLIKGTPRTGQPPMLVTSVPRLVVRSSSGPASF